MSKPRDRKEYMQIWRLANKERMAESHRAWMQANPEKNRANVKRHMAKYPEDKAKAIKRSTEWMRTHPEKAKKFRSKWRQENKEKVNKTASARHRVRYSEDLDFRLKCNLRRYIVSAVRGKTGAKKAANTIKLIGCSIQELKSHLESLWQTGMSWENYGLYGWHIDHIRPLASFDFTDPEQQKICFHFSNLQPLWAKDNLVKSDNWNPA